MYEHVVITDILGRVLGRVRDDGYVEPAEGCSGRQMGVAAADRLLDTVYRILRPGDSLSLTLIEGSPPMATFADGEITLPGKPPATEETLGFWRELDRRLAKRWTEPRRERV